MRDNRYSSIGNKVTLDNVYITKVRKVNKIIFHCTATTPEQDVNAKDIDKWHLARWGKHSGIGYHYLVRKDGTIEKGRWSDYAGAHVKGHNRYTIAVAYEGGVKTNPKTGKIVSDFDAMPSIQEHVFVSLLEKLREGYNLAKYKVIGHREVRGVAKDCPCLNEDRIRMSL